MQQETKRIKPGPPGFAVKKVLVSLDKRQLRKLEEFRETYEGRRYRYNSEVIIALWEDQVDQRMNRMSRATDRTPEAFEERRRARQRGETYGPAQTKPNPLLVVNN